MYDRSTIAEFALTDNLLDDHDHRHQFGMWKNKVVSNGPVPKDSLAPVPGLSNAEIDKTMNAISSDQPDDGMKFSMEAHAECKAVARTCEKPTCLNVEGLPSKAMFARRAKLKNLEHIEIRFQVTSTNP